MKAFYTARYALIAAIGVMLAACSGAGTAATTIPSSSFVHPDTPVWYRYYYNSQGGLSKNLISVTHNVATFKFSPGVFVALVATGGAELTGNLTGKTVSDTVTVSGATYNFITQDPSSCGAPAAVRFYFRTPNFAYTHYWWSNPESYTMANGTATLTASLADPSQWSDWNGKPGTYDPNGFYAAVADVSQIGLSFGGCFFEDGVTVGGGNATMTSQFTEM